MHFVFDRVGYSKLHPSLSLPSPFHTNWELPHQNEYWHSDQKKAFAHSFKQALILSTIPFFLGTAESLHPRPSPSFLHTMVCLPPKPLFLSPCLLSPLFSSVCFSSYVCSFITLISLLFVTQAKRTKKVGVVGKYGTRYGASLRKQIKKIEITQHAKYTCSFCGKVSLPKVSQPLQFTHSIITTG